MKTFKIIFLAGMLVAGLQSAQATWITYDSSTITVGTAIPDNNLTGISSTFSVGGDTGITSIGFVQLHLTISGGYNGDLYAYLTHDGQTAILLNRIGTEGAGTFGSSQSGMNIVLNDYFGAANVHTAGTLISGNVYGADGRNASPTDLAGINGADPINNLNNFAGQSAFGSWTLFIADADGGGTATLDSWQLEITQVPEPVNVALGVFGGSFAVIQGFRYWKRKKVFGSPLWPQ
jgi:subtilisin-like proprotein convertase family protein